MTAKGVWDTSQINDMIDQVFSLNYRLTKLSIFTYNFNLIKLFNLSVNKVFILFYLNDYH